MKTDTILEAGSGNINEDFLVLENNLFGVFDGATSLDGKRFAGGKTGGLIASETAGSVFAKNHFPLARLAMDANRAIHDRMLRHGVNFTRKEQLWSTSAAVVRIKENVLEWIQTGDSFIILIFKDDSFKVLVEKEDHDFETLTLWKREAQQRAPIGASKLRVKGHAAQTGAGKIQWPVGQAAPERIMLSEALIEQIRKTRAGMNQFYGVLNGENEAGHFLNNGHEPIDGIKAVLLFTDGLSIPKQDPERTKKFESLVDNYLTLGLTGLKDKIRAMEQTDPQCIRYPRFKCHDDIAAIALTDI